MKRTIILAAFLSVVILSESVAAQTVPVKFAISETVDSGGVTTVKVTFQGRINGNLQIADLTTVAIDPAACFERSDYPNPRILGPDRASIVYNEATRSSTLRWVIGKDHGDSCRVLVVGESVDARDFVIWRKNLGSVAGVSEPTAAVGTYGRSSFQLFLEDGVAGTR